MAVRNGAEYIEAIRAAKSCVYLHGSRVEDVTAEPLFRGPLEAIASLYDMQHDQAHRDVLTFPSPRTGAPVATAFMIPSSAADENKLRKAFKLRTDRSYGFMGRGPDYMSTWLTAMHLGGIKGLGGAHWAKRVAKYYEHIRESDLFLTHMVVNPQIDRSKTSSQQEDATLHLRRVGETEVGIVVRGAKMLGTMAPLTDETVVFPLGGVAEGDDAYALGFAVPSNAPGLKYICRETVSPRPRSRFDHPFSSRFEEMDCVAIFDDVVVPWDRVFIDGSPGCAKDALPLSVEIAARTSVQSVARLVSQMEFFCGLALKLADAIGVGQIQHIQEKLGDMLASLEIARTVYWHGEPFSMHALTLQAGAVYARFVEIVKTIGAGGFFSVPSEADMESAELRPFIDKYYRGRPGVTANERIALFKLAWDVTGETFGQRMQQYVKYYNGDPVRFSAVLLAMHPEKEALAALVTKALAGEEPSAGGLAQRSRGTRRRGRSPRPR